MRELSDDVMTVASRLLRREGPDAARRMLLFMQGLVEAGDAEKEALEKSMRPVDELAIPARWIIFLGQRERRVQRLIDTLYQQAAENPAWFEGIRAATLEAFFGGMDMWFISARNELGRERILRYAEQILSQDPMTFPAGLREKGRGVERVAKMLANS
jgi:hypothetical protein